MKLGRFFERKLVDEFWPFDNDIFKFIYLVNDSFLYKLAIFLDSIHIYMKKLRFVDVEIGVGRALNEVVVQS